MYSVPTLDRRRAGELGSAGFGPGPTAAGDRPEAKPKAGTTGVFGERRDLLPVMEGDDDGSAATEVDIGRVSIGGSRRGCAE